MKWFAISGSWRLKSAELEKDLLMAIDDIIKNGDGIVSGGALGVDYLATEKMLTTPDWQKRIKIIIPTSLEAYKKHYLKRADEGVITKEQASSLINQLSRVKNGGGLFEMNHDEEMDDDKTYKDAYYARNTEVVKNCDELLAFQINDSGGVQDTVDKAIKLDKKVILKKYYVEEL